MTYPPGGSSTKILASVLVALLLVVGLSDGDFVVEVVQASEILTAIERGESVDYDYVIIEGDLDLSGRVLKTVHFNNTKFRGNVTFEGANFTENAWFMGANFSGYANFYETEFSGGPAYFYQALFSGGYADFREKILVPFQEELYKISTCRKTVANEPPRAPLGK